MRAIPVFARFILIFFVHSLVYSQNSRVEISSGSIKSEEKKLLKSARKEFDNGNYDLAAEKYTELLRLDSLSPVYNFEQAQTFYSNFRQPQAIPFFEKAIKFSKDTVGEAYYLLANAYHLAGQFDLAQKNYRIYQNLLHIHGTNLTNEEEADLNSDINHKIELCDNGKLLFSVPPADKLTLNGKAHSFRISSLGSDVNSIYDDYGAVLAGNDSLMYFTSRREGTTGGKTDWDGKFFEDIYGSNLGKQSWEKSFNVGPPINSKMHEAIIDISSDGKTIYFYRGLNKGTFYYSTFKGNVWTKPEILFKEAELNPGSNTSFFGYTIFENELYVVSDCDTAKTGRDIYLSKKTENGSWGPLTNIGAPINTEYDEDAPFLSSDGNTMYFSSKGHNSMGGFDIFKSERKGVTWSEPVNLGVPFNTPGDDIYFIIADKTGRAYYSSSSKASDGTKDMDIYMIDLCDDIPETILAGVTFGISNGIVSVSEKATGQKTGDFNIENNKYSIPLKHGVSYHFILQAPSVIEPVSFDISTPQMCKVYSLYQEIEFAQASRSVTIKNAFFDIKKETSPEKYSEFLATVDKNNMPLYSEIKVPVSVILAKVETAKTTTTSIGTTTVTNAGVTTTLTAGTHSVTNTEVITTPTAGTHSVATTAGVTTAGTHSVTNTEVITTPTAGTHSVATTAGVTTAGTHSVTNTEVITSPTAGTHSVDATAGITTATIATTAGTHSVTTSEVITATSAVTHSVTTTTAPTHSVITSNATITTTANTSSGDASVTTTISVNNILFDYDKANMRSEFISELDKVVGFLKSTKKSKIEVAGYTDSKGPEGYNLGLSKRRANIVAAYLVSKGISKDRIKAVGYGESRSIAPNENPDGSDNPEGRAKNRRTEITVIQ